MADSNAKPEVTILPGGNPWSSYMPDVYRGRVGPQPLGTVIFEEIEAKAKEKLKDYKGAFMYAGGSAGTNSTYRANLKAFEKWGIIPRMLVDATRRSLEVTIFGVTHSSPIFIAPIGVQATFHPDGEFNPARAGKALGVPFISSTASSRSIEEVAEANGDGYRWYQLYWPRSNDVTLSLLKRAKDNDFKALVITLDTMSIGWRPHDLEISYIPFAHGVGVQIGKSDPVFMAKHGKKVIHEHPEFPYDAAKIDNAFAAGDPKAREDVYLGSEWLKEANSGLYHSWEDLKFIRDNWEGPLLLKGIQSVHVRLLIDNFSSRQSNCYLVLGRGEGTRSRVNGIIVSNHGGRQLDGAIPSLLALEVIMKSQKVKAAQQAGELTILFDSGIRTGSDIIKAMALGAQAVLLGRPWLYGSIVAGQAGVEQVIRHTLADLDTSLGLAGFKSLDEIQGKGEEVIMKIA